MIISLNTSNLKLEQGVNKLSVANFSYRTHGCGELNKDHTGSRVTICGWVSSVRDHGGLIFVDVRDRSGTVQVVGDPGTAAFLDLEKLHGQYVVKITGTVRKRPQGTENPKMKTGEIEIAAEEVEVLSTSNTPPFEIESEIDVDERLRLKYRYLDLRRPSMQSNIIFRSKVSFEVRRFLIDNGFVEVETPYLTKSTPEGARDFLVPSRLHPGKFYALPQSPQLFKQILMVSGLDKYFQLARCFRDEDLRADRQPEHTQIDIEMSFVEEEHVLSLTEQLVKNIFALAGIELKTPFKRMSYEEAMTRYGSDKPDLRFPLEIMDLSEIFRGTEIAVFKTDEKSVVAGINPPKIYSRKELDNLTEIARAEGARGLAWFIKEGDELRSPLLKFASGREVEALKNLMLPDSTLLVLAGEKYRMLEILGRLRIEAGHEIYEINENEYQVLWVTDFPLLEWSEEEKRYKSKHHPFTRPKAETIDFLDTEPEKVVAHAYDLVINGIEVGGGSLRIYDPEMQKRIFAFLGIGEEEAREKFGFLLEAFEYGVPPHGGIALGLDRLIMIILGLKTIRDVIAFPKTQSGTCLLTGATDHVSQGQLRELRIRID